MNTLRILRPYLEGSPILGSTSDTSSVKKKSRDADTESFFAGSKSPIGFVTPDTPQNPEKAFVTKRESNNEWTPPARTVSKPASQIGASVARGLSRVSRHISMKRKENHLNPMIEVEVARPITPVAELNAMITVPEPTARRPTLPSSPRLGLPAPRRDQRSAVIRQPTMDVEPAESPFTTITLKTPEPLKRQISMITRSSRHTSANESLLSMYLSRTPQQQEMEKPEPPPKAQPKPRPPPMPLSARRGPDLAVASPEPIPSVRSTRVPIKYGAQSGAGAKEAFASNEWAERVRRGAAAKTIKDERRRSRSLDFAAAAPASAVRTPMYGRTLGIQTPTTHARGGSLSAVPARTPASAAARRFPATGASRAGYA